MNEYQNKMKKSKIKRKNELVVLFLSLIVFFCGFFIGSRVALKKQAVLSTFNRNTEIQNKNLKNDEIKNRFTTFQPAGVYMPWKQKRKDGEKVAYLTFDDGPSLNNTPRILEILNKNNIKATFFLIGKNAEINKDLVKEEVKEGHVVANHTYSHQLKYRQNPSLFVDDVNRCNLILRSVIGRDYDLKLVRFPGGSFNTRGLNMNPFKDAITKAGYHYVDWNDWIGDASGNNIPVDNLMNELKKYTNHDTVVILMHDAAAKTTTVQALPKVIEYLKSRGYTFETLN
ncbi:polysaccharide deacetylase family protein [Clostridium sp. Mt-5]|uniref:Polysaccharide deacetylase family protein n=1 Tax=Clostridium moutaii TaxID=3240932 RepID=A0ABV4BPG7_9CLOT